MLYHGKTVRELSPEELQAADDLASKGMADANRHYEQCRAALAEVAEERSRRLIASKLN